jgi:flagellar hook-basal body complex protein FliE
MIESLKNVAVGAFQGTTGANATGGILQDVTGFAKELARTVQQGENAAMAGVAGTMPVQQVVENVLAAERAVTTLVSVRDKAVSSLLELTRMQI